MPSHIDEILDDVLAAEGGYQDMAQDSGNWYKGKNLGTNRGVTPKALAKYTGKDPTKQDMQNLTEATARKLYKKNYVDPIVRNLHPHADILPQLVDMNINHGYSNTVVMLQRALGTTVDGQAGLGTRKEMQKFDPMILNDKLVDSRKDFYTTIVRNNPSQSRFIGGWMNRAESYRPEEPQVGEQYAPNGP